MYHRLELAISKLDSGCALFLSATRVRVAFVTLTTPTYITHSHNHTKGAKKELNSGIADNISNKAARHLVPFLMKHCVQSNFA